MLQVSWWRGRRRGIATRAPALPQAARNGPSRTAYAVSPTAGFTFPVISARFGPLSYVLDRRGAVKGGRRTRAATYAPPIPVDRAGHLIRYVGSFVQKNHLGTSCSPRRLAGHSSSELPAAHSGAVSLRRRQVLVFDWPLLCTPSRPHPSRGGGSNIIRKSAAGPLPVIAPLAPAAPPLRYDPGRPRTSRSPAGWIRRPGNRGRSR